MNTDSEAPQGCKYWIKCAVNHCPLDPDRKFRAVSSLDKQQVCLVKNNKARAKRLALKHPVECPKPVQNHALTGGYLTGGTV